MRSRYVLVVLMAAICAAALAAPALADQAYNVSGADTYRVGSTPPARISYDGTQQLSISENGPERRYVAVAQYTRNSEGGKAVVVARFIQKLSRDGSFDDLSDQDPDFLTVLNQPFAVQLDPTTMRGLRTLRGSVPFRATSPFGGEQLRGSLRHVPAGDVAGTPVVGVLFRADGPMSGTVPEHPNDVIAGTIRMRGTAYYALSDALLLALDATLTIEGTLTNGTQKIPVRIVYHRTIRATRPSASSKQATASNSRVTLERDRP
jgi:hypothetical protein